MEINSQIMQIISHINLIVIFFGAIVHIIFAAGVAKDVGNFTKAKVSTQIVSATSWILATLIGGVFVALVYWLIHHSSLARR